MPNAAPGQQSAPNKQSDQSDPLKPLRLFIGKWEGDSTGATRRRENGARICLRVEEPICSSVEQGSVPAPGEESEG